MITQAKEDEELLHIYLTRVPTLYYKQQQTCAWVCPFLCYRL